ncbi:MAG: hypothetical protein ACI4WS_05975 [Oscillospiraceae bacterium]
MPEYIERGDVLEAIEARRNNAARFKDYYGAAALNSLYEVISDKDCFPAINNTSKVQSNRIVYVCSPYSGDVDKNVENARRYCRFVVEQGYMPLAPHLRFPQFLDDSNSIEHEKGMNFASILMGFCSEIWVFGLDISKGMQAEIAMADSKGCEIKWFWDGANGRLERRYTLKEYHERSIRNLKGNDKSI